MIRFNKKAVFMFLTGICLLTLASAYSHYDSSYYSSTPYGMGYPYSNPLIDFDSFSAGNIDSSSKFSSKNLDSSSLDYDYRGPMFERQITLKENVKSKRSDTDFIIFSRNKESFRESRTITLVEKYVGASESLFIDNKNNRIATFDSNQKTTDGANKGDSFSWRKARLFDPQEYTDSSDYYYRPYYDSDLGYYNWRW
ncbi:hypothetical protein HYV49_03980 [Candidatus Pacearchaeota archaeon]|nr:hypothetical protein [Candidatus Pacearchaeota archaeon]